METNVRLSDKGFAVSFPLREPVVVINKSKVRTSDVYVYTEMKGALVINYCDKCCEQYYTILSVNNGSLMNTQVRLVRCAHSADITPYLRSSGIMKRFESLSNNLCFNSSSVT